MISTTIGSGLFNSSFVSTSDFLLTINTTNTPISAYQTNLTSPLSFYYDVDNQQSFVIDNSSIYSYNQDNQQLSYFFLFESRSLFRHPLNHLLYFTNTRNNSISYTNDSHYQHRQGDGPLHLSNEDISDLKISSSSPQSYNHIQPTFLFISNTGDIYFSDSTACLIHRIMYNQSRYEISNTTIIAGIINTCGYSSSSKSTNALLNHPNAIWIDSLSQHLYIADVDNHRIRQIVLNDSIITSIAGTGKRGFSGDHSNATNAKLSYPQGISGDAYGNLYIADTGNYRIRYIKHQDHHIYTIAGTGSNSLSHK